MCVCVCVCVHNAGITILLSLSVFQLIVAEMVPSTSMAVPLVGEIQRRRFLLYFENRALKVHSKTATISHNKRITI